MELNRVQAPGNLREDVTKALRAAIAAGHLFPGTVYSVPTLARQLGVSPTPAREAILDLAKEGLITVVRNKGFRVCELSDTELDEITELRTLLEVPIVTELSGKLSPPLIDHIRDLAQAIVTAAEGADLAAYLDADTAFHAALLQAHGNRLLVQTVTQLRNRTRLYGLNALVHNGKLVHSAAEHLELIKLLETGRTGEVAALMRLHLSHVRGIWAGPASHP